MIREIKFRAWSDKLNKFYNNGAVYTPGLLSYELNGGFMEAEGGSSVYSFEQYTGLRDRDEKEIYEGDIVAITDHDVPFQPKGAIAVEFWRVNYSKKRAGFLFVRKDGRHNRVRTPISTAQEDISIIGNIHENADLAKET